MRINRDWGGFHYIVVSDAIDRQREPDITVKLDDFLEKDLKDATRVWRSVGGVVCHPSEAVAYLPFRSDPVNLIVPEELLMNPDASDPVILWTPSSPGHSQS